MNKHFNTPESFNLLFKECKFVGISRYWQGTSIEQDELVVIDGIECDHCCRSDDLSTMKWAENVAKQLTAETGVKWVAYDTGPPNAFFRYGVKQKGQKK